MDNAKYIIVEYGFGTESAIIFPCWVNHGEVAKAFTHNRDKILSAGMVQFMPTINDEESTVTVHCFGHSTTLDKKPRPEDEYIIRKQIASPDPY